jgi:hypothetical protein
VLPGRFDDPSITVIPEPHRVFERHGVSFRYPRAFTFEADVEDADVKSSTLSGNDLKIMFFVFGALVSPEDFARGVLSQLSKATPSVNERPASLRLGEETLEGVVFHFSVAGNRMRMEAYRIPRPGGRLLVLQDNADASGGRSREGAAALKVLEASFALTR